MDLRLLRLVKNDMTLFKPFTTVVVGAAGASGLFNSFQNRIEKVTEQSKQNKKTITL